MKKIILGLFLGMSVMGMAANKDVSEDLNINLKVVVPLKITEKTPMNFGTQFVGANEITAEGEMEITGDQGATIRISYANDNTFISNENDENDKIKVQLSSDHAYAQTTLSESGYLKETINGKISGGKLTKAGKYSGSVSVSVRYE